MPKPEEPQNPQHLLARAQEWGRSTEEQRHPWETLAHGIGKATFMGVTMLAVRTIELTERIKDETTSV